MIESQLFEKLLNENTVNGKSVFAGSFLARTAAAHPDRVALICADVTVTFAELYRRASYISYLLQERGVMPRDRVFLLFENSIEFYVGYFGIWQCGAVVTPLNTFLHEKELQHIVTDAKPKALVAFSGLTAPFQSLVSTIITEVDMRTGDQIPQEKTEFPVYSLEPDELAALLYTSGTTGFPKGVMLSSRNILINILQGVCRLNVTHQERIFAVLPLFHAFAQNTCVWATIFAGATTIVVPKVDRRLMLDALKHQPTIFLGVPALYGILCLMKTAPLDSVDHFFSGGDALPDKIRGAFELIYRRKISSGYGLTETSPVVSADFEDLLLPTNCVGKPVIGMSLSIRDEQGKEMLKDEVGILWVKGENVMLGYYQAPELTKEVLKDGWFNTGDFATIDEQGRLYICGRFKDLIINKGINIYPQEIENLLLTHPAVFMAAVVGKAEESVGEVPIAFISLRKPMQDVEVELKELCARSLAAYKVPKQFIFLESLPVTAMGKVDKKKLKAEHIR